MYDIRWIFELKCIGTGRTPRRRVADASKGAPRSSRTPHPQTQILFRRIAMPILLVVREVHAEVMAGAIAVASMYSISRFISMSARILSSIDMASMRAGPSRRRRPRASWIERAPGSRSRRRRRVVVVWRGAGIKVAHRRVRKPSDMQRPYFAKGGGSLFDDR